MLQRFHSYLLLSLLEREDANLFLGFTPEQQQTAKHRITRAILATQPDSHFLLADSLQTLKDANPNSATPAALLDEATRDACLIRAGIDPSCPRVYEGLRESKRVYKGLGEFMELMRVCENLRGFMRAYENSRGFTRVYEGLGGFRGFRGGAGVARVYENLKGLRGFKGVLRGLRGFTGGFEGL